MDELLLVRPLLKCIGFNLYQASMDHSSNGKEMYVSSSKSDFFNDGEKQADAKLETALMGVLFDDINDSHSKLKKQQLQN